MKSNRNRTGPQPGRRRNTANVEAIVASLVLDQGLSYEQAAAQCKVGSVQVVKTMVAREQGRREPQIDAQDLSLTVKKKLEIAIRAHERRLAIEFEARVRAECEARLNSISLPHYVKQMAQLERSSCAICLT